MNDKLIKSSVQITLLLGALLTLYFLFSDFKNGISIAVGVLFSLGNIYLLWRLIQETIKEGERSKKNIAGLLVLKFIILWGGVIALMAVNIVNPLFFAIGFSVILFVFAMKGFGSWFYSYFLLQKKH